MKRTDPTPENPPLLPNRVAGSLLSPDDHSFVSRITPIELKRRELSEARELEEPHERELSESTANARNFGKVKPI